MKLKLLLFVSFVILLFSYCKNEKTDSNPITIAPPLSPKEATKKIIQEELYHPEIIKSQVFTIGKTDTIIKTKNGSTIKIYANSFQPKDSTQKLTEPVKIEIKEVFKKSEMVFGNLTTLLGDEILESGGMIYINAISGNQELELSKNKEIGISIPSKKMKPGMQIYQGISNDASVSWINPQPVLNERIEKLDRTSYRARYKYYNYDEPITAKERKAIWEVIRDKKTEPGDRLVVNDHVLQIYNISKTTVKFSQEKDGTFIQDVMTDKGVNNMIKDVNTNYIFSVKNLGWVNIDRIYKDPKAEIIDLMVKVNDSNLFDYIYTTLIFDNREIYIPGYQKKDNSFSFARNDSDKFVARIGEEVTILATSYKDKKPFFQIKKLKIKKQMSIQIDLLETTIDDLKSKIEKEI